jgi:hypothetical protein
VAEAIARALKDLRRKELAPMAEEYRSRWPIRALEQAHVPVEVQRATGRRERGGRPNRHESRGIGHPRKDEPTRSEEFLAIVRERPGISIRHAAEQMGVQPSSLYRVTAKLEGEGLIARDAQRGFVAHIGAPVAN